MEEQKNQQEVVELGKKLVTILEGVLSIGDWESSPFLKTSAARLKDLRDKAEGVHSVDSGGQDLKSEDLVPGKKEIPPGYLQVFVLLYQVDGSNLQNWLSTIKALSDYSVNRPVYGDEAHVQEFIRSKVENMDSNGYVIVNVKETDRFLEADQVDVFDHQLLGLKEDAIKIENIVEFIHINKKRYAVRDNELKFLGEI